ncbi:hypothetical protein [Streptomyces sp. Ncost-T10-10d]|uniref:hypothetical protein n=1 Tax=Streptomyces sp. Ncost-T10-10d TaxID=1839774 RepID=UPI00081D41AB|nr:hypothetical protein [Streptomyces sp. Ncost-T10-10d]SCF57587.1 hypothetical protein GA0115254_104111 [Streptomyces sp. Ncost-T10-10d]
MFDVIATAGVDWSGLIADGDHASTGTRDAPPTLSAAIIAYDVPDDGTARLAA